MNALTVNVEEATKLTRLGRDHIRELVAAGKLPNVGRQSRIRIPRTAIDRFLENPDHNAGAK